MTSDAWFNYGLFYAGASREGIIDGPPTPSAKVVPLASVAASVRPPRWSGSAFRPESLAFTAMLGLLAALPALSIDISQPTFLVVTSELGASLRVIGLTLTLFMAGFALGQFGAGPLSDQYGRRAPMIVALAIYTAAGVGCSLVSSAPALLAWRLAQGISAGACVVLAFAVVRDLFDGEAARIKRSYVTTFVSLAPVLAPSLGAFVLGHWGWRPIYAILAAGGALMLAVVCTKFQETRPVRPAVRLDLVRAYRLVLSDRRFLAPAIVNALSYGGVFAYIAGSPAVLIGNLALTPAGYGMFFACTAVALTAGAFASGRSGRRGIGPRQLLWAGLGGGAVTTALFAALVVAGWVTLPTVLLLLVANSFCRGLTSPNAQHVALEPMSEHAGTAAAALGVMQILTGAAASAAVTMLLPALGPGAMSHVMAAFAIAALALWVAVLRRPLAA